MKKTNLKIHITNNTYHKVRFEHPKRIEVRNPKKKRSAFQFLYDFLFFVGNGVFNVCHAVGNAVLRLFVWVPNSTVRHLTLSRKKLNSYKQLFTNRQFQISFLVFLFFAFASIGMFKSARLVAIGLELKQKVLGIATKGADHLLEAQKLASNNDIQGAQNQFILALQSFKTSKEQFNQTGQLINKIVNLLPQKHDADRLFNAASYISKSGVELLNFYDDVTSLNVSPQGLSSEVSIKDLFADMDKQLSDSITDLNQADILLNDVNESSLPESYRGTFGEIKGKIGVLKTSLSNLQELLAITKTIALGKKKILFLFENNNELRAGGGFIGTYGDMTVEDGKITKLTVSSIYDLDGQLLEKIAPPTPELAVNDQWFMRDSNWFASFPDSAKAVTRFYEKEGGETPDVVIALTPSLIVDMLKITGPVDMSAYHVTLDADNFVETTQVETSLNYDKRANTPKQMLADFIPALLQRVSELPADQMQQILLSFQKNLNAKQLVIFSRDSDLQRQLENFHWTGSFSDTDRDYLAIVNSNLGGTKTDLSMKQDMQLETTIEADGSMINHLTITRTNQLPKMNETFNTDFMRVYVPKGSQLISNRGFDYKNLDTKELKERKTDPQVAEWEKSSVKDVTTGTLIGQESGKTYFGNWVMLGGGESRKIELVYRLPFTLQKLDHHSLILQKQIGSVEDYFSYSLNFGNRQLLWENFDTDNLKDNTITKRLTIDKDYLLGVVLNDQ